MILYIWLWIIWLWIDFDTQTNGGYSLVLWYPTNGGYSLVLWYPNKWGLFVSILIPKPMELFIDTLIPSQWGLFIGTLIPSQWGLFIDILISKPIRVIHWYYDTQSWGYNVTIVIKLLKIWITFEYLNYFESLKLHIWFGKCLSIWTILSY